eukprot:512953-Rhodomonas_salina.4
MQVSKKVKKIRGKKGGGRGISTWAAHDLEGGLWLLGGKMAEGDGRVGASTERRFPQTLCELRKRPWGYHNTVSSQQQQTKKLCTVALRQDVPGVLGSAVTLAGQWSVNLARAKVDMVRRSSLASHVAASSAEK